jgi:flagellar biosynthesis/type III secretory pathway M-ring protein FliF/YscJ
VNSTQGITFHAADTAPWDQPWISPGLLGFIIVVILGLATWLLVRSMSKQLRKLDADRPEQDEAGTVEREAAAPHEPEPNGAH